MKKKYELAKKQGLNWQALLIEETQSEIKALIERMYLNRNSYYEINREVVKVVRATIEELESEQLKATAEPSLYRFATKVYNYMKEHFRSLNWVVMSALVAVASNRASVEQMRVVRELSQETMGSYNMGLPLDVYANEYMDYVKDRIERLAKFEAKEDYTSRVNLRNIAEMQIRQERHEQELMDLKANGVNLVWIVPHANCSERCEDWQGKLYSLDDTYGEIDGIKYQPLKNATDRYETTKSGKVYKNGCLSGFNCFDKETEVLTNQGWKLFSELNGEELIYTLNKDTKQSEWQKPINYFKQLYNGEMVHLSSFTSDLMVTPNHNMLYYTQRDHNLRFKQACEIGVYDKIYCGQEWKGTKCNVVIDNQIVDTKLFCRLLGYWLADGSIHDNSSIKISQQNNDVMWESLKELPFKLWRDSDKIIIRNRALRDMFAKLGKCQDKYVYDWLKELPKECLQEFLDAYVFTDGYTTKPKQINGYLRKPHKLVFTTNKQLCADLCEIALKCGYRPRVDTIKQQGKMQQFKNGTYTLNYDMFIIHLNYNTSFMYKSIKMEQYNDYVYCVEVPNHTLLVKRNGFIQWCGNCRHTIEPYKKGNKPIEIPSAVIEKQREINNKQRYLERGVRDWKEKALLFKYIDKRLYKFARAKAKQWNERYIEYSKNNNVAYYPSRTEII